mmetsp:Transcript_64168/g.106106  ORF Transcript_64168/g.106106 Transcript_64168/m.106106 type:complete len:91 (+) Transcript_64168:638-910(+)
MCFLPIAKDALATAHAHVTVALGRDTAKPPRVAAIANASGTGRGAPGVPRGPRKLQRWRPRQRRLFLCCNASDGVLGAHMAPHALALEAA